MKLRLEILEILYNFVAASTPLYLLPLKSFLQETVSVFYI
jgi:hypothetical protein